MTLSGPLIDLAGLSASEGGGAAPGRRDATAGWIARLPRGEFRKRTFALHAGAQCTARLQAFVAAQGWKYAQLVGVSALAREWLVSGGCLGGGGGPAFGECGGSSRVLT